MKSIPLTEAGHGLVFMVSEVPYVLRGKKWLEHNAGTGVIGSARLVPTRPPPRLLSEPPSQRAEPSFVLAHLQSTVICPLLALPFLSFPFSQRRQAHG